jgi:redox-sensitive bicupin YhaK (pirin superfamily)
MPLSSDRSICRTISSEFAGFSVDCLALFSLEQKGDDDMSTQVFEKLPNIQPKDHARSGGRKFAIGDGFSATSYSHTDFAGLMDPLIMVDHFVKTKPAFGTHAHAGLSAVTVMFEDSEGAFHNRDSLGNDVDLAPGDLYWFKAARGALHNEEPRSGARTHALQVFVNLPEDKRNDAPAAFHLPAGDIPRIAGDRSSARLVLGQSNGIQGASAPDIALTLLDITLQAGGQFSHQGEGDQHAWIVSIQGTTEVAWVAGTTVLRPGSALALTGAPDISVSSELGAHAVLFQAPPLGEGFIQRGPFAMGSEAELDAVEAAYHGGRLGSID